MSRKFMIEEDYLDQFPPFPKRTTNKKLGKSERKTTKNLNFLARKRIKIFWANYPYPNCFTPENSPKTAENQEKQQKRNKIIQNLQPCIYDELYLSSACPFGLFYMLQRYRFWFLKDGYRLFIS